MKPPADSWLSPAQVAARFGVSTDTIRRWGRIGRLREYRTPAGHRRFRAEDVEALAAGVTSGAPAAESPALVTERTSPRKRRSALPRDEQQEVETWEQHVLEAEAEVDVLKAHHELEELAQARRRRNDTRAEKATAAAAVEQEARRLKTLKDLGRLHASLAGVPPVWLARVSQALERYVTSEHLPPGLHDAEAQALVKDKVDDVLHPYREELADAKQAREDRLRVERLLTHGKSRTFLLDHRPRKKIRRAVEEALENEVEADWTEADVSELVDEVVAEWEEEEDYEEDYQE